MQIGAEDVSQQVLRQLDHALEEGTIAPNYREWAGNLRDRLQNPVQVIVIGRAGVGKSSVIDALLGRAVVRGMEGTPEIHVVQGQGVRCYVEYPDSSSEWRPGLLSEQSFDHPVERACQELPDAVLAERNLIEIGLPDHAEDAAHVLAQAVASADILIWCSPDFTPQERELLSQVPDRLRDHAFLVLTKADEGTTQTRPEQLAQRIGRQLAEDFLGLFPVSLAGSGEAAPGIRTLKQTLDRQIDLGRAAELDQARMILRQLASPARPVGPVARPQTRPPARAPSGRGPASAASMILRESGQDLLRQLDLAGGALTGAQVMDHCQRTLDTLSRMLTEQRAGRRAIDLVEGGQEMLLLIQLEKGKTAPQDAVTLLLQLRRELVALEED